MQLLQYKSGCNNQLSKIMNIDLPSSIGQTRGGSCNSEKSRRNRMVHIHPVPSTSILVPPSIPPSSNTNCVCVCGRVSWWRGGNMSQATGDVWRMEIPAKHLNVPIKFLEWCFSSPLLSWANFLLLC